jgi:8-oxo-dGTP diphosphatase
MVTSVAKVHVVVGILLNSDNQVLIAQRLAHQEKGGVWEFPGGKVEAGELAFAALQREFKEEIGIDVISADPWMQVEYHYPHKSVFLDTWLITDYLGTPCGQEGQPIAWGSVHDLKNREFPEGNKPIIEKLLALLSQS